MTAEELISLDAPSSSGDALCLTCSWQKQSSVLVHMVAELGLRIDIGRARHAPLLPRVLRDARRARRALPARSSIQPDDPDGRRAAPRRRAEPLGARSRPLLPHPQGRAARPGARSRTTPGSPASAATSRRAASTRRRCSGRSATSVLKIHPLADWDEKRVWAYIDVNEIPYNPLHDAGYRSIGCIPCTRPTTPDEEERAGRWAGSDKLECGIHENDETGKDDMSQHIYAHEHPESETDRGGGFTLWFTGLSGLGQDDDRAPRRPRARPPRPRRRVPRRRHGAHAPLEGPRLLEGGPRREHRAASAGSPRASRATAAPSSSRRSRPTSRRATNARALVEEHGPFVEIHVATSLDECARRDVNGLYAKAFAGEIKGFTGVDDPYEAPANAEIVVDTEGLEPGGVGRASSSRSSRSSASSPAKVTA